MADFSILHDFEFVVTEQGLDLVRRSETPLSSGAAQNARMALNRNRNRNRSQMGDQDDLAILEPWQERAKLYELRDEWMNLPLPLPPSQPELRAQAVDLLKKQALLTLPQNAMRREEILVEADLELSRYLRPYGIESYGGYDATIHLMLVALALTDEIGLYYKARWNVPRPNQVEPRLRPFLAAPAHASYHSNHAFQSFTIAFLMSRIIPEHPGSAQLFLSARRIAENREWAGVHYACDTEAGHALARMILPVLEKVLEPNMLAAQAEWQ